MTIWVSLSTLIQVASIVWALLATAEYTGPSFAILKWGWVSLWTVGLLAALLGHRHWQVGFVVAATVWLFVGSVWFNDDDRWKRLWGKLKSAALTAVNRARFNREIKESVA